jgi:hypothetical protein
MKLMDKVRYSVRFARNLPQRMDAMQQALGRIEQRLTALGDLEGTRRNEFKVYSQNGEDGIVQYLLRKVAIEHTVFAELGVEDYLESNTRFLLVNNNWSGLVVDASAANVAFIRADPINFRYNLRADCAMIDRDNVDALLRRNGIEGDIGLLSVDIDGNDYWVWEAISAVQPRIVVVEYNSLFGARRAVSIPYDAAFVRSRAHYACTYYGASIAALDFLAHRKGYALVGGNTMGNNVFFVRQDVLGDLRPVTPQEAYVRAQFRETRDANGQHTFPSFEAARALIAHLPLIDVTTSERITVGDT